LERLIPKSIRYLIISGSMADDDLDDYLSSINWIRLISNCSNNLQRIKLDLSSYFDPSDSSGLKKHYQNLEKIIFFVIQLFIVKTFLLQSKDISNLVFIIESICLFVFL
jgi:hypothetical protein